MLIYDNGKTLIGRVGAVREYAKEHTSDEEFNEADELLRDISEYNENDIVIIDYEIVINNMVYCIKADKKVDGKNVYDDRNIIVGDPREIKAYLIDNGQENWQIEGVINELDNYKDDSIIAVYLDDDEVTYFIERWK